MKMKTDQREIGKPSGDKRACREINPVGARQILRHKRVSGAFFQLPE